MPGVAHEAVIQLLADSPERVKAMLSSLGYAAPKGDARLVDTVLSGLELRADCVVVIGPDNVAGGPSPGLEQAPWGVLAVACSALDLHKPADRLRALNAVAQASAEHVGGTIS